MSARSAPRALAWVMIAAAVSTSSTAEARRVPAFAQRLDRQVATVALTSSEGEIGSCLVEHGVARATVRATFTPVGPASRLSLRVTAGAARACVEAAARRHLVPLTQRSARVAFSVSVRVDRPSTPAPAPTDDAAVHRAIDGARASWQGCLASLDAPTAIVVRVAADGQLSFEGSDVAISAQTLDDLHCLERAIGALRVGPSSAPRTVPYELVAR